MNWDGTTVIITGASRGIGASVARAAAAKGAKVGLVARAKDELEQVLRSCGGAGAIAAADIGDRQQAEEAVASVERELGPAGVLVNNAGIGAYGPFAGQDVETVERLMRVNYLGTVYATKAVLPGMIARGAGHIVNVASIAGRVGAPLEAAYSASKFAVAGLSQALWFELRNKGVGVSVINPGPVATEFFAARGAPYARKTPKPVSPDAVAEAVVRAVEKGAAEVFVPRWLRMPPGIAALMPAAFRMGTLREFRNDLA